jgi:hypothetical protein
MMVSEDDVLLKVNQNWGIVDENGSDVLLIVNGNDALLLVNRDDVLWMVNQNWSIDDG